MLRFLWTEHFCALRLRGMATDCSPQRAADEIVKLAMARGLSRRKLALLAGFNDTTLRHLGTSRWNPTLSTLNTLFSALHAAPSPHRQG